MRVDKMARKTGKRKTFYTVHVLEDFHHWHKYD